MAGAWARRLADVPRIEVEPEGHDWHPLQHHFRLSAFGANVFVARREGAELVGEHDERASGQEELYVVLAGRALFALDGAQHEAGTGDLVVVTEPAVRRSARALVAGTSVLAVGAPARSDFASTWSSRHFAAVPTAEGA